MPNFEKETECVSVFELEITPEEFVDECTEDEIKELVSAIKEQYPEHLDPNHYQNLCVPEQEFELMINSLHGKWNTISREEEELIRSVAKRFL